MEVRRITVNIAGRVYPLNVPAAEEETLRKVGKQIENMIKDLKTLNLSNEKLEEVIKVAKKYV